MSNFSKNMPIKPSPSDNENSFMLGRKSFANKTYHSHLSENLPPNLTSLTSAKKNYTSLYTSFSPTSSATHGIIPLNNKGNNLRTQRLRLNAVGRGSMSLKDSNDNIRFAGANNTNFINFKMM